VEISNLKEGVEAVSFQSCDTIVALGEATNSGNVIFAKNSDRPPNEAQPLTLCEAHDYPISSMVNCTYLSIPQAKHTFRVLGSRPFWMWGFEFGINEHSVVIGNEAVWAREPVENTNGLIGMDLLRLGLERGDTAKASLKVITNLLECYGQGGNAVHEGRMHYHNAFLIADPMEAWVLETVNRRWVARRVKDIECLSNCYSTGTNWDIASNDIREYAYQNGWASPNAPFDFARAYGALSQENSDAEPRRARARQLLEQARGALDTEYVKAVLRDHFEDVPLLAPRWSAADGAFVSICMHCRDALSSKTAAACVVELQLGAMPKWQSCFSSPCISVFIPFDIFANLPLKVSHAGPFFSADSLWWKFERLCYMIETNYPLYSHWACEAWKTLERAFSAYVPGGDMTNNYIESAERTLDILYQQILENKAPAEKTQHVDCLRSIASKAGIFIR